MWDGFIESRLTWGQSCLRVFCPTPAHRGAYFLGIVWKEPENIVWAIACKDNVIEAAIVGRDIPNIATEWNPFQPESHGVSVNHAFKSNVLKDTIGYRYYVHEPIVVLDPAVVGPPVPPLVWEAPTFAKKFAPQQPVAAIEVPDDSDSDSDDDLIVGETVYPRAPRPPKAGEVVVELD